MELEREEKKSAMQCVCDIGAVRTPVCSPYYMPWTTPHCYVSQSLRQTAMDCYRRNIICVFSIWIRRIGWKFLELPYIHGNENQGNISQNISPLFKQITPS